MKLLLLLFALALSGCAFKYSTDGEKSQMDFSFSPTAEDVKTIKALRR